MNVDFRDRVVAIHGEEGGEVWIKVDEIVAVVAVVTDEPDVVPGTVTLRSGAQLNVSREACMILIEQLNIGHEKMP